MCGPDERNGSMFSYVSPEDRVPPDHPLRSIRRITDRALERLSPTFDSLYLKLGRPSVRPSSCCARCCCRCCTAFEASGS